MRSIAERLVFRVTAAAQRNHRPPGQSVLFSRRIANGELALEAQWAVIQRQYFGCHLYDRSRAAMMKLIDGKTKRGPSYVQVERASSRSLSRTSRWTVLGKQRFGRL